MKHTVKYRPSSKVVAAKSPWQVSDLIKEIQDTVYNVASKYLKAEGWDMSDIADYFVVYVSEAEPGVIRAEIRGELEYEQLSELCSQLDKVIAVKFDKDAYFEPVEPGIAETFIRTNVKACSNVTASDTGKFTMQDVQALIDDYVTEYFEAIPTSGGRELWFSVFDVGSYHISIVDGKIMMIPLDDPKEEARSFRTLDKFSKYLERQITIGEQEADMNYSANASTVINASEQSTLSKKDIKELAEIIVDIWDTVPESSGPYNYIDTIKNDYGFTKKFTIYDFEEAWDMAWHMSEDGHIEEDDDIVHIGGNAYTREDAADWLQDKLNRYGNTYDFPDNDKAVLEALIDKFGSTYFWH